jgi:hypothetical protein
MLTRFAEHTSIARLGKLAALICIPILIPSNPFNPAIALAQSSQLNPSSQSNPLPEILPNISADQLASREKAKHTPARTLGDKLPDKPTLTPIYKIPLDSLGFTPPGAIYLGKRNALASLDFIGEDRILFTFRVPGLIRREEGRRPGEDERQIRAMVVNIKTGQAEAEALWTVHDRARYLWMLKDGHFILRDRDILQLGDSSLVLKPLFQFPGPVDWLELDPQQLYIVTNSREPAKVEPKPGQVDSPSTAQATMDIDTPPSTTSPDPKASTSPDPKATTAPDSNATAPLETVVRILERSTGKVMLVSRVRTTVHLPINSEGYLERLRGNGQTWLLNLNLFTGAIRTIGRVESSCAPGLDFISQSEFLINTCAARGEARMVAFTTGGTRLWEDDWTTSAIWATTVMGPDGSRLARETLQVSRAVNAYSPFDSDDVKGQLIRIINTADGSVALEAAANPPLDVGGNVAISPTGNRAALLTDGALQVFDLPPAPPPPPLP